MKPINQTYKFFDRVKKNLYNSSFDLVKIITEFSYKDAKDKVEKFYIV